MDYDRRRLVGSAAFAGSLTLLWGLGPLLAGSRAAAWVQFLFFPLGMAVSYRAWAMLDDPWQSLTRQNPWRVILTVVTALVLGAGLPRVVAWLTGWSNGEAALVVLPLILAATSGVAWLRARRTPRPGQGAG